MLSDRWRNESNIKWKYSSKLSPNCKYSTCVNVLSYFPQLQTSLRQVHSFVILLLGVILLHVFVPVCEIVVQGATIALMPNTAVLRPVVWLAAQAVSHCCTVLCCRWIMALMRAEL